MTTSACRGDRGNCPRDVYALGLCRAHWERNRKGLPIDMPIGRPGRPRLHSGCTTPGCGEPHLADGKCRRCYDRGRKR